MIIFNFPNFPYKDLIMALIAILICKSSVCVCYTYVFNYMAEIYPTSIRATGCGIVTFVARFIGALPPIVSRIVNNWGYPILPIVSNSYLVPFVIVSAYFLPETLNKKLQ